MSNTTSRLRKSAIIALSALGLGTLGAVAVPASASAATPLHQQANVSANSADPHHLHVLHVEHLAAAAGTAPAATTASSATTSATTVSSVTASGSPQQIAAQLVPAGQLASFDEIISHESGWNVNATNASSGAYGLPQALPGSKMASAGADWQTDAGTQIRWALSYMDSTYGSPNSAWSFWQAHHWY